MTFWFRSRLTGSCLVLLALAMASQPAVPAQAATSEINDRTVLRVCADPNNLPYSDDRGEGFENKIAELIAEDLGVPLAYTWFPQTVGFVRSTLGTRRCDLIIGVATTNELMQNTNPYYRSGYVLIHRADVPLTSADLDDPLLKTLRIGAQVGTPAATMLAHRGLLRNARSYKLVVDTRLEKPARDMVADLASGEIDVALTWGPLGGYWAKQIDPSLVVRPLKSGRGTERTDFRISMGIRYNEPEWKHRLNDILKNHKAEIEAILLDYGVPLLDAKGELISPQAIAAAAAGDVPEPEGYRMTNYRSPVPKGLKEARTADLEEVQALVDHDDVVLIDVMQAPPMPDNRPADALWREPTRETIAGATWLANMGFGRLSEKDEAAFEAKLEELAGPDKDRTLVFFCEPDCWMSWNAAKRARAHGFKNVVWFPGGVTAWKKAGLETATVEPWRP